MRDTNDDVAANFQKMFEEFEQNYAKNVFVEDVNPITI